MNNWEITITIKSVHDGTVVEVLPTMAFPSRLEAEQYMLTHPTWENHFTYPVAELFNHLYGRINLDPTNWNHIHGKDK